MSQVAGPILLMALAGVLLGGSMSLRKNEKYVASLVCGLVAAAAFVGGALLLYGGA